MTGMRGGFVGVGAVAALLISISGCDGGSTPQPSHPGATSTAAAALAPTGCSTGLLPAGYVVDPKHTGKLTAHNYSAAADVQAALEFDQLGKGSRNVYLLHAKSGKVTNVASCITMPFPSAHVAGRFFMSYRALRADAGSIVHRIRLPKPVPSLSGVTAYLEKQQSFRGYRIAATNVIEAAGQAGSRLDIVSVSGVSPSRSLARRLLAAMAGVA